MEKIIGHRKKPSGVTELLVRWKGSYADSYEPSANVTEPARREYWDSLKVPSKSVSAKVGPLYEYAQQTLKTAITVDKTRQEPTEHDTPLEALSEETLALAFLATVAEQAGLASRPNRGINSHTADSHAAAMCELVVRVRGRCRAREGAALRGARCAAAPPARVCASICVTHCVVRYYFVSAGPWACVSVRAWSYSLLRPIFYTPLDSLTKFLSERTRSPFGRSNRSGAYE